MTRYPYGGGAILPRTACRACGGSLVEILNLGALSLNAFPTESRDIATIPTVLLILTVCRSCALVQLDRTTPPDLLYREYWYRSSINESMVAELYEVVGDALAATGPLPHRAIVVDIGANDGTLLRQYAEHHTHPYLIGVDPAKNLQERLGSVANLAVADYFPTPALDSFKGKCSIVTAVACAYDVEQPVAFFRGIAQLLDLGGVAVIQFQDFGQMIDAAAFDNICHEHLEYYTLGSLQAALIEAGLHATYVVRTPINGGSLRVVCRRTHDRRYVHASVDQQLAREAAQGLQPVSRGGDYGPYIHFRERVEQAQRQISAVFSGVLDQGCVCDLYGASTKGNILQQVLGIGPQNVRFAIERAPEKIGRYTITGVPIVSEATAQREPADCWIVPIWQFRETVLQRERAYLEGGGQIIFPLPVCEVVRAWPAALVS